jgi:hypothetical protein
MAEFRQRATGAPRIIVPLKCSGPLGTSEEHHD